LPRVLIFGQPFNNSHGGGITLSNLFKGWERDRIAVAATGHMMAGVTTDICDNYYQLGSDEFRWNFPFNLIQRKFRSGQLSFSTNPGSANVKNKRSLRYALVNKVFYPVLEWLGLFYAISKIRFSSGFKNWLDAFNPDIIYIQVSTREGILFASEIIEYLKIPSVIHIMDDWPSTISNRGLFRKFWHKKIDIEFRNLLEQIDLNLSISEAMSAEYMKRYNKEFLPFHNPIDIDLWLPNQKKNYSFVGKEHISLLFSGRIGIGISTSLLEIASAVELLQNRNSKLRLYIQSTTGDHPVLQKLREYPFVIINPPAEYSEIPSIFSGADMLLLANDFNDSAIDYLRLSMPTKASEYMISGTPVIVYSPEETAVSSYFRKNGCGHCVTTNQADQIASEIEVMLNDEQYRRKIASKAISLAAEQFNGEKVRHHFQQQLIRIMH